MDADRGRAIVASALPEQADALCILLRQAGFTEVFCVSDGLSALRQAQARVTDFILADAVLPMLDGVELEKRMYDVPMLVYPKLAVAGTMPQNAAQSILKRPISREALERALEDLSVERRAVPEKKQRLAKALLSELGMPEHPGRDYLLRAIEMAWLDGRLLNQLTTRLYPAVAAQFGVDRRRVERAMRHAIDVAWRGGEMEAQYRLFGDTIDARRGSPTLGEMIAQIADILRWEGKA